MSIHHAQKKGKKYQNTVFTPDVGFGKLLPILKEYITNKQENVPQAQWKLFKTDANVYDTPSAEGMRITWIGHSSVLIEIDGVCLLTDPVWSDRVSFSKYMGPKRFFKPPIALSELPPIDGIIQSHDHYDHLDKETVKFFAERNVPYYCSEGVGWYLKRWGVRASLITELNWGDTVKVNNLVNITATPARHFSGRGMFNRNETLWSSWVIRGSKHNIFFGADSGMFPGFKAIGEAYGPFDLTMLEVGAYGKHWPDIHMGPANAIDAHIDLKGKLMMPIHWGTFNLAPHAWFEPIEKLMNIASERHVDLFVPEPGKPEEITGAYNSLWWKPYIHKSG